MCSWYLLENNIIRAKRRTFFKNIQNECLNGVKMSKEECGGRRKLRKVMKFEIKIQYRE